MKISAHILLKNESRFAWYSIMSIINYVDTINIWDTGSSDGTVEIIENIAKVNKNINFKKLGIDIFDEEKIRGEMLQNDNSDWIIIVDGDEIWWEKSIQKVIDVIKSNRNDIESIVVPTYNLVGDIFHYQEKEAGRYNLAGHVGHYGLRAFNRRIPGLTTKGEHGVFGWFDNDGKRIEERDPSKMIFVDGPYIHATHLKRSNINDDVLKRIKKYKYEIGEEFPEDFYFPEVFFKDRPEYVPYAFEPMTKMYKLRAFFETPFKKLYRRFFLDTKKYGY